MQKVFVLDTCVLLHDPKAIFNFDDNEVIVPYAVLEELENKKRLLDEVGRSAREAIRLFDQLRQNGQLAEGVSLPDGGTFRIELNHYSENPLPLYSDIKLPDNRILAVALNLGREDERPVIVVTKDIAMRVKADALSVKTQDYYNDKISLTSLNDDVIKLELKDSEVNGLYQIGHISLIEPKLPNSCAKGLLSDGTVIPLIVSCDGTKLIKLHSRNKDHWGIVPKNIEQTWALGILSNPQIKLVNLMGPAGTGKTLITLASALEQTIHQDLYTRILCARPVIPFGKDIGFLPGEKEDKVRPYMQPIYDNLEFLLRPKQDKLRDKDSEALVESTVDLLKKESSWKSKSLPIFEAEVLLISLLSLMKPRISPLTRSRPLLLVPVRERKSFFAAIRIKSTILIWIKKATGWPMWLPD